MIANKKGAGQGALVQHSTHAKYTPTRTESARDILRDAIIAAGVDASKARVRDEFSSFMRELDRGAVEVTT